MKTIDRAKASREEVDAAIASVFETGESLTILENGKPRSQVCVPKAVRGYDDLDEATALRGALETMGMVAGDLKDQRDAREEECAELRGHVRNLIEALVGKVRAKGEISRRVRAAEEYLMRPRHSAPLKRRSPQAKEKP